MNLGVIKNVFLEFFMYCSEVNDVSSDDVGFVIRVDYMERSGTSSVLTYAEIQARASIPCQVGAPGLISRLWLRTPC